MRLEPKLRSMKQVPEQPLREVRFRELELRNEQESSCLKWLPNEQLQEQRRSHPLQGGKTRRMSEVTNARPKQAGLVLR
jgi:hypothetical protein